MTELVDPDTIEAVVGVKRKDFAHVGLAISSEGNFVILHSKDCKAAVPDLRDCLYSRALDRGVNHSAWRGHMDKPYTLSLINGLLFPDQRAR